jgi:hypothetical protein
LKQKRQWRSAEKTRLLVLAMHELAGDAFVSFEGNLKGLGILSLPQSSAFETKNLKRATNWPEQDFVVLPLEASQIPTIMGAIGGLVSRRIRHVQIEKRGVREFAAYDFFDPTCVVVGPGKQGGETQSYLSQI